jgi:alkylhydroperoxidase family enzyme
MSDTATLKKEMNMSLLEIMTPESAEGDIKQTYDRFKKAIGQVPETLQLLSASPALFQRQMDVNLYFRDHPHLSFPLQTLIRYRTASDCHNAVCERFNHALLRRQGMSDEEIRLLHEDPRSASVEEREQEMLAFVVRAIARPEEVCAEDIEALKQRGWNDADILDAVYHGVLMVSTGIITRIFKV